MSRRERSSDRWSRLDDRRDRARSLRGAKILHAALVGTYTAFGPIFLKLGSSASAASIIEWQSVCASHGWNGLVSNRLLDPGSRAMKTLCIRSQSGSDGKLHLEIPVESPNVFYDVVVVTQAGRAVAEAPRFQDGEWPPGFFEATAGMWQGEFVRDQGQFEERENL
jgi:hypothetical protein